MSPSFIRLLPVCGINHRRISLRQFSYFDIVNSLVSSMVIFNVVDVIDYRESNFWSAQIIKFRIEKKIKKDIFL